MDQVKCKREWITVLSTHTVHLCSFLSLSFLLFTPALDHPYGRTNAASKDWWYSFFSISLFCPYFCPSLLCLQKEQISYSTPDSKFVARMGSFWKCCCELFQYLWKAVLWLMPEPLRSGVVWFLSQQLLLLCCGNWQLIKVCSKN